MEYTRSTSPFDSLTIHCYNPLAVNDFLERHRMAVFVVLSVLIVIGGAVFLLRQPVAEPIEITLPEPTQALPTPTPGPLRVYITGAVRRPDVYTLPPGSIVKDGLEAAGGPAPDADLDRVNLAQRLSDGQQVTIPRRGEAVPLTQATVSPSSATPGGRVNLNTASVQELATLPGIGAVLAQRIVDYRTEHGPFKSIEEIKNVGGIGEAKFEQLQGLITVGP